MVDDNETDVLILNEVLKNCGFPVEVRVANDGAAALECLNAFAPGLILLDLNLPKVSGFDVLAEIRRREALARVPVVIVTSSNSISDLELSKKLNATAYFCKPATLTEYMNLAGIVRTILSPPAGEIS